jgi:rare lipoprotein A
LARWETQQASGESPGQVLGDVYSIRLRPGQLSTRATLLFAILSCFVSCLLSTALAAQKSASADASRANAKAAQHAHLDRSGKTRKGKASYYGRAFYEKKMADGTPMNPHSNVAASKTLPIGTKARVTNLKNGNSEVVEIRDRGPYVKDRIVDLSPRTADKLGLKKDGVAPVEVKPVEVPQADGTVKPGAAVQESERGRSPAEMGDSHSLR